MSPIHVLVVFYSRCGATERLALAAAVGAVQERAAIRLRRLPDSVDTNPIEESAECRENLRRMHKEYVSPMEADVVWAEAIIFVLPPRLKTSPAKLSPIFEGNLDGKVVGVSDEATDCTAYGRKIVADVRAKSRKP